MPPIPSVIAANRKYTEETIDQAILALGMGLKAQRHVKAYRKFRMGLANMGAFAVNQEHWCWDVVARHDFATQLQRIIPDVKRIRDAQVFTTDFMIDLKNVLYEERMINSSVDFIDYLTNLYTRRMTG
jgi:hypothetical protein